MEKTGNEIFYGLGLFLFFFQLWPFLDLKQLVQSLVETVGVIIVEVDEASFVLEQKLLHFGTTELVGPYKLGRLFVSDGLVNILAETEIYEKKFFSRFAIHDIFWLNIIVCNLQ